MGWPHILSLCASVFKGLPRSRAKVLVYTPIGIQPYFMLVQNPIAGDHRYGETFGRNKQPFLVSEFLHFLNLVADESRIEENLDPFELQIRQCRVDCFSATVRWTVWTSCQHTQITSGMSFCDPHQDHSPGSFCDGSVA